MIWLTGIVASMALVGLALSPLMTSNYKGRRRAPRGWRG